MSRRHETCNFGEHDTSVSRVNMTTLFIPDFGEHDTTNLVTCLYPDFGEHDTSAPADLGGEIHY